MSDQIYQKMDQYFKYLKLYFLYRKSYSHLVDFSLMSTRYTENETVPSLRTKAFTLKLGVVQFSPPHPTNIHDRNTNVDGKELICYAHLFFTSVELGPELSVNANYNCGVTTLSSDRQNHNLFYSITDTSNTFVFYQLTELWLPTFYIHTVQREINLLYFLLSAQVTNILLDHRVAFFWFVLFLKIRVIC